MATRSLRADSAQRLHLRLQAQLAKLTARVEYLELIVLTHERDLGPIRTARKLVLGRRR
jgi:hypothetical protein